MIFIEQFQARWPWSVGMLESWLSRSSSKAQASSILRIPSPRRSLQRTHLQRPLLRMSSTAGDKTSRGRNPENGRRLGFRRRHWQSGFQHSYRPRPCSLELFNKDDDAGRENLSHLNIKIVRMVNTVTCCIQITILYLLILVKGVVLSFPHIVWYAECNVANSTYQCVWEASVFDH